MNGYIGGGSGSWLPAPNNNNPLPTVSEAPDFIGAVTAYRSWTLVEGELRSHNFTTWTPGKTMRASCSRSKKHSDIAPVDNCSCGIYSAKEKDVGNVPLGSINTIICGEVYLWGKVLEGPRGYRSEFAYPKQFFARSEKQKRAIEDLGFGVPVTVVKGRRHTEFPFQLSRRARVGRLLLHYGNGLPLLVAGVFDALLWNMSHWYSQVVVSLVFFLGLTSFSIPFILRWQIRRILS